MRSQLLRSSNLAALDSWIARPKSLTLTDTFTPTHLADLYITLPTRDRTRRNEGSNAPLLAPGTPLGYGHHLAFFHPRNPERALRPDGTDDDFCPPEPFTRRMWASGTMRWNTSPGGALCVGDTAHAVSTIASVEKKGFDSDVASSGAHPMVLVKQRIEVTAEGRAEPSVVEERSHVYLASPGNRRGAREGIVHSIRDCRAEPTDSLMTVAALPKPDFSFTYKPSSTTLFRFSALTFNGHHIHLDKDFAQKSEGYPGASLQGCQE